MQTEERPERLPREHGELHDPKLPSVHGQQSGNRAEQRVCPAPIPQNDTAL